MSYSNNHMKRRFDIYKYIIIVIMIAIYALFALIMNFNISNKELHDEIFMARLGLISLTTIMFIVTMRILTLKSREYYTQNKNK